MRTSCIGCSHFCPAVLFRCLRRRDITGNLREIKAQEKKERQKSEEGTERRREKRDQGKEKSAGMAKNEKPLKLKARKLEEASTRARNAAVCTASHGRHRPKEIVREGIKDKGGREGNAAREEKLLKQVPRKYEKMPARRTQRRKPGSWLRQLQEPEFKCIRTELSILFRCLRRRGYYREHPTVSGTEAGERRRS